MADRQFVVEVLDAQTAQIRSGGQIIGTLSVVGSRQTGAVAGPAASLVTWLGNGQSGTVGTNVGVPPAVRVLDASGLPVAGSTVTWFHGGGSGVTSTGTITTSDSNGVATVGSWSLGTTAGSEYTLFAYSTNLTNSPIRFSLTPTAGSAFSISASGGTSQTTTATGTYPSRLTALVHDQYGNPVNGAAITMSSTDANGVFGATSLTANSSGVAGTTYAAGQTASVQSILAAISSATSARFTMTITPADPVLTIVSGDGQISTSATSLPLRPTVRVADGFDNVWSSGQTIQFVVVTGSGTISSATSTPGSGGTADVDWKLGAGTGSNQLEVSLQGVSNSTLTFNASATNPQADTIAVFGGTGQSTTVAQATAATVEWIATGGGSASAGQVVTFDIVPSGSLSVAQTTSSSTGIIRVTPTAGTTASIYTVTATAAGLTGSPSKITFQGTAASASSLTFSTRPSSSAEAGTAFASQPVIITTDVYGNLVASNDDVTATLLSGTGPLTADNLVVTASGATATFSGMKVGASGAHVIAFDATSRSRCTSQVDATPPFATKLAFTTQPTGGVAGGNIGTVVVAVQDDQGTVVTGATDSVTLTLSAGGTLSGTLTVNAVGGYATFNNLTVDTAGTYTLSAAATGLTGATSASFTVTSTLHPNEPAGLTQLTERGFSASGEDGWTANSSGLRTDWTNAPISAPNYLRFSKANNGQSGSFSPGSFEKNITDVSEIYFHWHFRLSSTFWGHKDNINKLGPFLVSGTSPFLYLNAYGTDDATLYARVHLQGVVPSLGGNSASGDANFGGTVFPLVRDTTYSWEVYIKMNTNNVADGIIKSWVNGTQNVNKTNAAFRGTGGLSGSALITIARLNAIWGGTGADTMGGTTYIDIDNYYASGA